MLFADGCNDFNAFAFIFIVVLFYQLGRGFNAAKNAAKSDAGRAGLAWFFRHWLK
jgi:hypothetical protein